MRVESDQRSIFFIGCVRQAGVNWAVARLGVMPRWLLADADRGRLGSAARSWRRTCRCRGHHTICSKSYAKEPFRSPLPLGTVLKEDFEMKSLRILHSTKIHFTNVRLRKTPSP